MIETVGIRFKDAGKIYDFDADGKKFNKGDYAIVEIELTSENDVVNLSCDFEVIKEVTEDNLFKNKSLAKNQNIL